MEIEIIRSQPNTSIGPGHAFWLNKETLAELKPKFQKLITALDHPGDLFLTQWAQLSAMMLAFQPDLVIELGRGRGNSTCVFTESAKKIKGGKTKVVSFCLSEDWQKISIPRITSLVESGWFDPLEIKTENILEFDFEKLIAPYKRCMIFWDAHGFEIAECVLGKILPLIANKEHLVLMHDLSDSRYCDPKSKLYGNKGLWKGNNWSGPRLRIGVIDSAVEQAIAILDFTTRNEIELHSADHDLNQYYKKEFPERFDQTLQILGNDYFSLSAHWFYFSLNERSGVFTFPQLTHDPVKPSAPELPEQQQQSLRQWVKTLLKKVIRRVLG